MAIAMNSRENCTSRLICVLVIQISVFEDKIHISKKNLVLLLYLQTYKIKCCRILSIFWSAPQTIIEKHSLAK